MMGKLRVHYQGLPRWAPLCPDDFNVVMDPPSTDPWPGHKTIGRVYVPDGDSNAMVMRGAVGANEWYARCLDAYQRAPWIWAWQGPNEPGCSGLDQCTALVLFTQRWVGLMHQVGYRTVALCLSVGWPDVGQAHDLADALLSTDYWSLHEYGAPTMQTPSDWYCLRYRRTVAELLTAGARVPPLIITECGIDGGVVGKPKTGWKSFATREQYQAQLAWYDDEIAKDDYVVAATVFTAGPNGDWNDFETDEDLVRWIHNRATDPAPTPPHPGGTMPEHSIALRRPLPDGVGTVSQWYGQHPEFYQPYGLAGHEGLDYACPEGSQVLAAHDGIAQQWQSDAYGTYLVVTGTGDHAKVVTYYCHLSQVLLAGPVVAGAVIGLTGNTGRSTGPHLHWGLRVQGVVNPAYQDFQNPYLGRWLNGDA